MTVSTRSNTFQYRRVPATTFDNARTDHEQRRDTRPTEAVARGPTTRVRCGSLRSPQGAAAGSVVGMEPAANAGTGHGRPAPFSAYTTPKLWNDPHISSQMLALHLAADETAASRPHRFIEASTSWIAAEFGLGRGSRVLDLGCGPGLYANQLASRGTRVVGIDVSARSVRHARLTAQRDALPAEFREGNYLVDELGGGYDLACLIYEDYCALSPSQRTGLMVRVRKALNQGGAVLFDVTAAPRFDAFRDGSVTERNLMGGFWSDRPYIGTCETWTYPELRLALERYTIRTDAGLTRQYWNWTLTA